MTGMLGGSSGGGQSLPQNLTTTATPTFAGLVGTTTNNNASAGNIGEYIESVVGTVAVNGTTGQYKDITSISLTAGDWDVTGIMVFSPANSSSTTYFGTGISVTSGNSGTGLVQGSNFVIFVPESTTLALKPTLVIPSYRMSLAGTTTVYFKCFVNYTVGTPTTDGSRLSARRIR